MKQTHQVLLVFLAAFLIASDINAQVNEINIGAELGPSMTTLRGNEILDEYNGPKIGLTGSLNLSISFNKYIFLQTGLGYERKGSVARDFGTDPFGNPLIGNKIHANFNYLMMPMVLGTDIGAKTKFYVAIGPFIGILLKQVFVYEAYGNFPEIKTNNTASDKRIDFGLTTSVGLKIPLNEKIKLKIELRDNLGLINISKAKLIDEGTIKTNSASLIMGMLVQIGSKDND